MVALAGWVPDQRAWSVSALGSLDKYITNYNSWHLLRLLKFVCNADSVRQSSPKNKVLPAGEFITARKGQVRAVCYRMEKCAVRAEKAKGGMSLVGVPAS